MSIHVAIIVPCLNEGKVLSETNRQLLSLLTKLRGAGLINAQSGVHYVDDGSKDETWELIEAFAKADARVHAIKLSRNHGHQPALLAGLLTVKGDALITIDADLQDDMQVIEEMLKLHRGGAEVVYGVRNARTTDSFFKRNTALLYYRLMRVFGVDLVPNHADFRLLGRRAIETLRGYREVNIFLRGIVPLLGYPSAIVSYARGKRFAGTSKYSLSKILSFAIDGMTSFSIVPLRIITLLGLTICGLSLIMIIFVIHSALILKATIPGWASSVILIYFIGGIQLFSIGVLGEYISKIYMETKQRPRYVIEKEI